MRMVNAHQEVVFLADEQVTFGGRPGDTLGLFGFPRAHASSRGLKWELNHFPLIMGERSSACNALLDDVVTIDVKGQALMIKANKDFTHLNGEK
jgi:thiamine pyrophosphokinase